MSRLLSSLVMGSLAGLALGGPMWFILAVQTPGYGRLDVPIVVFIGLIVVNGVAFFSVVGLLAAAWGALAAAIIGVDRRLMARAVAQTTLLTVVPVAFAVDMTQLVGAVVEPFHRFALHTVFGLAFAAGYASLLGRMVWRVETVVEGLGQDRPRLWQVVAVATAVGAVAGALWAAWSGWEVAPGQGGAVRPAHYAVAWGAGLAGGAMFGWRLVPKAVVKRREIEG